MTFPARCLVLCLAVNSIIPDTAAADDPYTFLYWANGWRGRSAEGGKVLHVQTNRYGAAFEAGKPGLFHLGPIRDGASYAEAAAQSNALITDLADSELRLTAMVDGAAYECVRAASKRDDEMNYPVRIIESGRILQRFDILHLEFEDARGNALDAEGRLEVLAWPERLHVLLEITPGASLRGGTFAAELKRGEETLREERSLKSGETLEVPLIWRVDDSLEKRDAADPEDAVAVKDAREGGAALPVHWDAARGWNYVDLPERVWDVSTDPDRLDRFPIAVTNPGDAPLTVPLLFAFDESFAGTTGMCPMLRDATGQPTGIPVQISKNWHRQENRRLLYEGPWFHGFSLVTVPAGGTWEGELAIAYARWGGVPSASHAQLCLIGWGTNQLWDQAAIGSWGESICYDPDVNLNRSMIDDARPLMVTGMRGGQWTWTHNVGGGDFLVYFDETGGKQYLTRMKTAYLSQGPNLTRVIYAGVSADGKIAARIEVMTPRCDDVNRAYHRIRYDVLAPTAFSRLAFYQLGADKYNDHQFTTMARGNAEGLIEEWPVEQGGLRYSRQAMACEGDAPWFSLHGGFRSPHLEAGAWANRGLVVRSWRARLGGKEVPVPDAAVYGTENGVASANVELVPPPDLTQLLPGDFVEAEIELLIPPTSADDYYGPNTPFLKDLEENADTWRVIHRLARGNDLDIDIQHGTLDRALPIQVALNPQQIAVFEVRGGVGYVPITFTGLERPDGYTLELNGVPVDQQVHGNDFWQTTFDDATKSYSRTYNVSFDSDDGGNSLGNFHFSP